jgi:hypothetical protein
VDSLASLVKAKYPDYANVDNLQLVTAITQKHPEYNAALQPQEAQRLTAATQPGAFQTAPGGPTMNTKQLTPPDQPSMAGEMGGKLRDTALAAAQTVVPNATTDPMQNLKNIGSGMNTQVNQAATTPWGQGGPIWGTLAMLANGLKNAVSGAGSGAKEFGTGVMSGDPDKITHGGGTFLGNAMQLRGGEEGATGESNFRKNVQNVFNEGPSKVNFLGDQYKDATTIFQPHVKAAVDNAKTQAWQAMQGPAQQMEAAHPDGVISKADLKSAMTDALGSQDKSQAPSSFNELTAEAKAGKPASSVRALTGRELESANAIQKSILNKGGSMDDVQSALENLGFAPKQVEAMKSTMKRAAEEAPSAAKGMTVSDLMQARTKLGEDAYHLDGPSGAIASAGYAKISGILRDAAVKAGVEPEWIEGNAKYSKYSSLRKALKPTLEGEDAADIMKPFGDKSRARVMDLISQHPDAGFDVSGLHKAVGKYNVGEKMDTMADPNKRTLMMAALGGPKFAAASVALPRALRSELATKAMFGEGLKKISPKQVYTNQKAAAKAGSKSFGDWPGAK